MPMWKGQRGGGGGGGVGLQAGGEGPLCTVTHRRTGHAPADAFPAAPCPAASSCTELQGAWALHHHAAAEHAALHVVVHRGQHLHRRLRRLREARGRSTGPLKMHACVSHVAGHRQGKAQRSAEPPPNSQPGAPPRTGMTDRSLASASRSLARAPCRCTNASPRLVPSALSTIFTSSSHSSGAHGWRGRVRGCRGRGSSGWWRAGAYRTGALARTRPPAAWSPGCGRARPPRTPCIAPGTPLRVAPPPPAGPHPQEFRDLGLGQLGREAAQLDKPAAVAGWRAGAGSGRVSSDGGDAHVWWRAGGCALACRDRRLPRQAAQQRPSAGNTSAGTPPSPLRSPLLKRHLVLVHARCQDGSDACARRAGGQTSGTVGRTVGGWAARGARSGTPPATRLQPQGPVRHQSKQCNAAACGRAWVGGHQRRQRGVERRQAGDAADQGGHGVEARQRDARHVAVAAAGLGEQAPARRRGAWSLAALAAACSAPALPPLLQPPHSPSPGQLPSHPIRLRAPSPPCLPHLALETHSPAAARLYSSSGTKLALMTLPSSVRSWNTAWPAGGGAGGGWGLWGQ